MPHTETAQRVWRICLDCAESVYSRTPPTPDYANAVARLLFMTAAHESGGFRWRRQLGFSPTSTRGAFSLWQWECGSFGDSLAQLRRSKLLLDNVNRWLYPDDDYCVLSLSRAVILAAVQYPCADNLGCLFARLHYLRVKEAIPRDVEAQALYAKNHSPAADIRAATVDGYVNTYMHWARGLEQ